MSKRKKEPLFSKIAAIYFGLVSRARVSFKRGLIGKREYLCKKFPELVTCFGWEGDKHAPISYIDGSFCLRDRKNTFVTFGVNKIEGKVKWYNKDGWLPCLVSEFKRGNLYITIENFADKLSINSKDFVIAYSRMTLKNVSDKDESCPRVSPMLVLINNNEKRVIKANETLVFDYAVAADRFGNSYKFPSDNELKKAGGFDEHYEHMKTYWEKRLEPLVRLNLPDKDLENAYRAGYVYTMIVKDEFELHVGENGYDRVFDHDVIGIIAALLTMGDFKYFDEYSKYILQHVQYPDARWKYSWVFALYLQKTGDVELIKNRFYEIKKNTHYIEKERSDTGIMRRTNAIDSNGYWTIDNWSALTGLSAYKFICGRLGEKNEFEWAEQQYNELFSATENKLKKTIDVYGLNYLPISMTEANETGQRNDIRDANWASMFLFGRWAWDGYLLGAEQSGMMIDLIDKTYDHGFERRKEISGKDNFGGYPHGYFSSAYNAGYGGAALRGEKHRSLGIEAYKFLIEQAQSGPFSWWEGIGYPDKASPWNIPHAARGGGSCPHIWGQSTATKVLVDSLISEKTDGTFIVGRGLPEEWLKPGAKTEIFNFSVSNNKKIDCSIKADEKNIYVTLSGDANVVKAVAEFPGRESVQLIFGETTKISLF